MWGRASPTNSSAVSPRRWVHAGVTPSTETERERLPKKRRVLWERAWPYLGVKRSAASWREAINSSLKSPHPIPDLGGGHCETDGDNVPNGNVNRDPSQSPLAAGSR